MIMNVQLGSFCSFHIRPAADLATVFIALLFAVLGLTTAKLVDIDGRCPSECTDDIIGLFEECAPLVKKGCTFSRCDETTYSCSYNRNGPDYYELGETASFSQFDFNETVTVPISLMSIKPNVDLYLLMDATFTNRVLLRDSQESFPKFMDAFSTLSVDAAFGAGIFRDESELWNGFANVQSITVKTGLVESAFKETVGEGGLDYFESNLVALYQAATNSSVEWRKYSRKFVILAAAFVGHEPTCTGDLPKLDREIVAKTLRKEGVVPILYSAPDNVMDAATVPYGCTGTETAGAGQGSYVAKNGGGDFIKGKAKSLDTMELMSSIQSLFYSVNVNTKDCNDILNIETNLTSNILPYGSGIELSFNLKEKLCRQSGSGPKKGKCKIEIDIEGLKTQEFNIVVDRYLNCPTNNTYDPSDQPQN